MIQGEKITLRAIESGDAPKYHQWINDEASNATRGLYLPTSFKDAQAWIDARTSPTQDSLWLALEIPDKAIIGFVGFRNMCSRSRRAEITIYIGDKSEWRKGYGKDAFNTLCRFGFESLNLFRIWLECDAEYARIVNAYEQVGFVQEGRLRKSYFRHGSYRDTLVMGLLKEDWDKRGK